MLSVISVRDPAIDWEAMTEQEKWEYAETRALEKVKIKPGEQPVIYKLREMPFFLWAGGAVSANRTTVDFSIAFRACLMSVTDLRDKRDPSKYAAGEQELQRPNGEALLDLRTVEDKFEPAIMLEIGAVAYERSLFPSATGRRFPLLPFCREHLERMRFRTAA